MLHDIISVALAVVTLGMVSVIFQSKNTIGIINGYAGSIRAAEGR